MRLLEYDSVGIATTLVEEEKAKLLRVKGTAHRRPRPTPGQSLVRRGSLPP